ncbi:unnamed protein product [Periconia digitata]|uniref:Uncharacterized protein n=1 Tax=Periconia digitata TaxID=1303443 RepID=A0A9W4XRL3_9PLEO|nr:unnamed protein product [Periconia digitata]
MSNSTMISKAPQWCLVILFVPIVTILGSRLYRILRVGSPTRNNKAIKLPWQTTTLLLLMTSLSPSPKYLIRTNHYLQRKLSSTSGARHLRSFRSFRIFI